MDTLNGPPGVDWITRTADALDRVRMSAPQIHVLTSTVAQPLSANLLLAVGAQPSMSSAPGEIDAFAARTDALVANLGMLDERRRTAIATAIPILRARGVPWVLDPVKVERSPARLAYARELLGLSPGVVRGNADETMLLGRTPGTVRASTGAIDRIEDEHRSIELRGGHPLMASVTAMGCAGTTLVAALLAVEDDAFVATVAAFLALGVAGELAAERVGGPGSFPAALLDALYHLSRADLARRARLG